MGKGRWWLVEIGLVLAIFAVLVTRLPTIRHYLANNDHGYQLAASAELLRGRIPGVDVFINYGPLTVLLGAITLHLSGGDLLVESLVCAAMWAFAIGLAFRFVRRNFGALAGAATALAAFLMVARFHKWFLWLMPLVILTTTDAATRMPARRRWLYAGLVAGLASLLRPDVGVGALAAAGVIALIDALLFGGVGVVGAWGVLVIGYALPILVWMVTIVAVSGGAGLASAVGVVPEMVGGTVESLSLPPPPFDLDKPFSPGTAHALALRLLLASELLAIGIGLWLARARLGGLAREARALVALGIMGAASYHQTVYRADIHHFWLGCWPMALAIPAIAAVATQLVRARPASPLVPSTVVGIVATVLVLLGTVGLRPIVTQPHFDLAPYGRPPLAGIRELRQGVAAAPDHPYAHFVAAIAGNSTPNDPVLMLAYQPQLFIFAERPVSGPTVAFQAGLFDSPEWRRIRLADLQRDPPALVVVPGNFWTLAPEDDLRRSLPEIYEFVHTHYRTVVTRQGRVMLLAPDTGFRAPSS
ncbi:MAG: hypothetical protein ABIR79_07245 [Candidatus Binatia bacterium]